MYKVGDKVDVLFQLDENNYMGNRKVQFYLKIYDWLDLKVQVMTNFH